MVLVRYILFFHNAITYVILSMDHVVETTLFIPCGNKTFILGPYQEKKMMSYSAANVIKLLKNIQFLRLYKRLLVKYTSSKISV